MGLKTEAKNFMKVGRPIKIHKNSLEYEGVVEQNTLISGSHNGVEADSCLIIRSDENRARYLVPLGSQVNFVVEIPFEDGEGTE